MTSTQLATVERLAEERRRLVEERAATEAALDLNKARLVAELEAAGVDEVAAGERRVRYFPTERATIKPELLLAAGVEPEQVAKATVVATSWTLRVW